MTELAKIANAYLIRERSDYQLKHFVIGQHDTPEMRYRQILIEARDLLYKIKMVELKMQRQRNKIEKLEASMDENDHIKAQESRLGLAMTSSVLEATRQELDYLVELSKDYRHYTPDEIEANQTDYWHKRLTRQAENDRISLEQGIGAGNAEALRQIGVLQKELLP